MDEQNNVNRFVPISLDIIWRTLAILYNDYSLLIIFPQYVCQMNWEGIERFQNSMARYNVSSNYNLRLFQSLWTHGKTEVINNHLEFETYQSKTVTQYLIKLSVTRMIIRYTIHINWRKNLWLLQSLSGDRSFVI